MLYFELIKKSMKYFIVNYTHPDEEGWKKFLQPHIDFLVDCVSKGYIYSSGPIMDSNVRSAMIIFSVESKAEAERLISEDPYTIHGQVGSCTIFEWTPLFGTMSNGTNEIPQELIS